MQLHRFKTVENTDNRLIISEKTDITDKSKTILNKIMNTILTLILIRPYSLV